MSIISTVPKGAAVEGINPNLLRNWYFVGGGTGRGVFPVNSRGQTSYTSASNVTVYSIDGWKNNIASGSTQELLSSGLKCTFTEGNLNQTLSSNLLGKQITISCLTSTGFYSGTGTLPSSIPSVTTAYVNISISTSLVMRLQVSSAGPVAVAFGFGTGEINMLAVKAEFGDQQTLAHQENGVWVLNEIPDYEYELYRCMTSTADSSDIYANKSLATEQQLAYVESGPTASRAYTAGDYFCWRGLMYRAKTDIAAGDTFTVNTNCLLSSEGGLNALNYDRKYAISFRSFLWNNNADLDTFLSPGIYWIGQNATHSVSTSPWCPLLVLPRGFSNPDTAMQILFLDGYISTRRLAGGTWTPWKTVTLST